MYNIWYSLIIGVVLAVALFAYFILSRKLKTPTVTTEILVEKYNKRLNKLALFMKKNKIMLTVDEYRSKIERSEIDLDKVKHNLASISNIEKNNELIEEVFLAKNKQEVEEKMQLFQKNCTLFEFAGELEPDQQVVDLFEMIGYSKTKLDFEKQRYFGSQNFYNIQNKLIFVTNSSALIVDEKNVFKSNLIKFELKIKKNAKKTEKNHPIYDICFKFGENETSVKLSVPQKENQSLLNKLIKRQEKTPLE